MSNPIWTLTGGMFEAGTSVDNTQTDTFNIFGTGNTVLEQYGNLLANGGNGAGFGSSWDSNTTITIGGSDVTDNITLDGGTNAVSGTLSYSTVNYTVTGLNGTLGGNSAKLDNSGGQTTVSMTGDFNSVTLNGDATNSVSFSGDDNTVLVGSQDDDNFGYSTTINLSGDENVVGSPGGEGTAAAGDENFTITGGTDGNNIYLGDGNNSVSLSGVGNFISVGGGDNSINAGGSGAIVQILGSELSNATAFPPGDDPADLAYVTSSPTDSVTISGAGDQVSATYENVNVVGLAVTSAAIITLGNGNNNVLLGGTGGNNVTLGNGGNSINASGNASIYRVGSGTNAITLSGNNNAIIVNTPPGTGTDTVQLGVGTGDMVNLGAAGGSVTAWAPFGTTTHVMQIGSRSVTVNLHGGTGIITLGDGNDHVTANGNVSTIHLGNGNNTINAGGNHDHVFVGNGSNTITANGANDTIIGGNGNDTVTAGGPGTSITLGHGNDVVTATSGDTVTILSAPTATDSVTVGNNNTVAVTHGTSTITGGAGNTFVLNGLNAHSVIYENGNNNLTFIGSDSSLLAHLNPANSSDVLTVQGDVGKTYAGNVEISGFGNNDQVDLQGLVGGVTHADFGSLSGSALLGAVLANMNFGPTGDTLSLVGGGSIKFDAPVAAFTVGSFASSTNTGPVFSA